MARTKRGRVQPADRGPVLAAYAWPTNGHLIAHIARLGYLTAEARTLDPTYGNGVWWRVWRPDVLVHHNWRVDGVDFRNLPHEDDTFDQAAFDPPYVAKGGRDTSTTDSMNEHYGLIEAPRTPALLHAYNMEGLTEVVRCVKVGGIIVTKCQSYVSSGDYFPGALYTWRDATAMGLVTVDQFHHLRKGTPHQPRRTRKDGQPSVQQHARNNYSTMYVFRKI